jgi:hypothetical protein
MREGLGVTRLGRGAFVEMQQRIKEAGGLEVEWRPMWKRRQPAQEASDGLPETPPMGREPGEERGPLQGLSDAAGDRGVEAERPASGEVLESDGRGAVERGPAVFCEARIAAYNAAALMGHAGGLRSPLDMTCPTCPSLAGMPCVTDERNALADHFEVRVSLDTGRHVSVVTLPARAPCPVCGRVEAVNRKSGRIRSHQEPTSALRCRGSGMPYSGPGLHERDVDAESEGT